MAQALRFSDLADSRRTADGALDALCCLVGGPAPQDSVPPDIGFFLLQWGFAEKLALPGEAAGPRSTHLRITEVGRLFLEECSLSGG